MTRPFPLIAKVRRVGIDHMTDSELVAIVLAHPRRDPGCWLQRANLFLDDLGGLPQLWTLARAESGPLALNHAEQVRLQAALELGLRCVEQSIEPRLRVSSAAEVAQLLIPRLGSLPHEQVWVVALDSQQRLIALRCVAKGGLHGCALTASDVMRVVLSVSAAGFVLVHNHPGADPSPSDHDIALTKRLYLAAQCVGVPLLDHVIVTHNAHCSLLNLGLIDRLHAERESEAPGMMEGR